MDQTVLYRMQTSFSGKKKIEQLVETPVTWRKLPWCHVWTQISKRYISYKNLEAQNVNLDLYIIEFLRTYTIISDLNSHWHT